jgi:GTPase SAR1 family protein
MLTLLLGFSTGVGKTAINTRFIHQSFSSQWNHTIGVDFHIKMLELGGLRLKLQGWPAYLSLSLFRSDRPERTSLVVLCAHKRSWCACSVGHYGA